MEWRLAVNSFTDVLFESVYSLHRSRPSWEALSGWRFAETTWVKVQSAVRLQSHFAPSNQVFLHTVRERQILYFRNGLMHSVGIVCSAELSRDYGAVLSQQRSAEICVQADHDGNAKPAHALQDGATRHVTHKVPLAGEDGQGR
jgi:hypothetical protein